MVTHSSTLAWKILWMDQVVVRVIIVIWLPYLMCLIYTKFCKSFFLSFFFFAFSISVNFLHSSVQYIVGRLYSWALHPRRWRANHAASFYLSLRASREPSRPGLGAAVGQLFGTAASGRLSGLQEPPASPLPAPEVC